MTRKRIGEGLLESFLMHADCEGTGHTLDSELVTGNQ